ncbi:MAG: SDR family NAD(P)-dependent oxidoreductase [Phenylobacterium sp.]
MEVAGKVVAITGGGAPCERLHREAAARVAVLDLKQANDRKVAQRIDDPGPALRRYARSRYPNPIAQVEARLGAIDLFCSNAAVLANDPEPSDPASSPDAAWALSRGVQVMSHVYAARHLGPKMAARGGGHSVNSVSAAGLLAQIGSGPPSASKHAARRRSLDPVPQGVAPPMVANAMETPTVGDDLLTPSSKVLQANDS